MKYKIKKTAGLLETVLEIYKGVSKQKAKQILSHSEFILDGKKIDRHPNTQVGEGSFLEINSIDKSNGKTKLPTRARPISIYFEDDYFLVALKPASILSCGSKTEKMNYSFHKELEKFMTERDDKKTRLWVVHRIDREVEGLNLFAKTEEYQTMIKENWQHVIKKYLALTENRPKTDTGFIESWLKDTAEQKVIELKKETADSKFAKTEYTYLRAEKKFHLLEIKLHTGRKNQIRVHLSGIGCPIVGDRKYGASPKPERQIRLAAYYLEFKHPVTGKTVELKYQPAAKFFNPSNKEDEKYKIL
jgi:23S rRNA pseudouridine1911/1915/1917 synthase